MAKEEEKNYNRSRRNRRASYILMFVFALVIAGGIVMLINGIKIDTNATSIDAVWAMVGKIVLCILGSILTLGGLFMLISAIVMAATKFEGKSRNPINNFF
ncbi:MAG: hypothetical protein IJU58_04075, partial [Clostridia bacterium]|nr:hypothetical protein [Clostridia bacterium]